MIALPPGARIWLAASGSDMRRGFNGLARQVQQVLGHDPFCGHLFVLDWRIASPKMFPRREVLPHLICCRPGLAGGVGDEAAEHGEA